MKDIIILRRTTTESTTMSLVVEFIENKDVYLQRYAPLDATFVRMETIAKEGIALVWCHKSGESTEVILHHPLTVELERRYQEKLRGIKPEEV